MGFIVKQQVMHIRVVFLNAVERLTHDLAAADHKLCTALGRSAQGSLGIIGGAARRRLAYGRVMVGIGKGLYALPQHGILAAVRAAGAGHQRDSLPARQHLCRVLRLIDKGGIIGRGGHDMHRLCFGDGFSALAGSQACQQGQRQEQC